jgi:hypothetical protein
MSVQHVSGLLRLAPGKADKLASAGERPHLVPRSAVRCPPHIRAHEIGKTKQVGVGVAAGAGVTTTHSIWPGKAPQESLAFIEIR